MRIVCEQLNRSLSEQASVEVTPTNCNLQNQQVQTTNYNISKLVYYILKEMPEDKRMVVSSNIKADNFREGDWYDGSETDSDDDAFSRGYDFGSAILGIPGGIVCGAVAGVADLIKIVVEGIF